MSPAHGRRASRLERPLSLPAEAGIVVAVLLVWQAARIPLEGGVPVSLKHAHEWLSLQSRLGLTGLQNAVITFVHHRWILPAARWSYANLHVFAIFAFLVALRAAAPDRSARVRNAFVLLHIPALIAIGLFPLASPSWLPHPPDWPGGHPAFNGSLDTDLRNLTGTVASEHFGYPVLIAAGTLWAARGRPLAWPIVLYPAWVFLFIVGTGHHYPLDAVVGTLCVVFGFTGAWLVHRRSAVRGDAHPAPAAPGPVRWAAHGHGSGLLAGWSNALVSGDIHLNHPTPLSLAAPAVAVVALAVAWSRLAAPSARGVAAQRLRPERPVGDDTRDPRVLDNPLQ